MMTGILLTMPMMEAPPAKALSVPVESVSTTSGSSIGFVDMEKIFQEFPETQKAKAEYLAEVQEKRGVLLEKELALKEIKDRIDILKTPLQNGTTAAVSAPLKSQKLPAEQTTALILRQQELSEKGKELETDRLKAEQALVTSERRRSQIILGRIYVILKELAEESQVSIVIDKSYLLYGTPQVDLTEKLRERLRTE